MVVDWQDELEHWLAPFISALRHKTRGRLCPAYIAGLIGPGDRKSVQPMAARDAGEHRSTGERKYYLSNLPANTPLKQLAGAIKARWICEQAHQQLKEELGLDHFEGRSWTGLHRHALMTMIAYAFLQSRRLNQARGGKKNRRTAAATKPSRCPAGNPHHARQAAAHTLPSLQQTSLQ
jgi:SRSO17 transposase